MRVGFGNSYKEIPLKDIVLIASIPIILTINFLLPSNVKNILTLHYFSPTILGFYFTHFVHETLPHFLGNLIFYILIVCFIYYLAVKGESKKEFYYSFFIFILILPLIISFFNLLLVSVKQLGFNKTLGFSGINSAFLGVLPYFSLMLLKKRFWPKLKLPIGMNSFIFFAAGFEVFIYRSYLISFSLGTSLILAIFLWIGFLAYLIKFLLDIKRVEGFNFSRKNKKTNLAALTFFIAIFAIYATLLTGVFPSTLIVGKSIVNIFAHSMGLSVGLGISILFGQIKSKEEFRGHGVLIS